MGFQDCSALGGRNQAFKLWQGQRVRSFSARPLPSKEALRVQAGGNLAIVDDFTRKGISITVPEQAHQLKARASHGQVVEAHARLIDPDLQIHRVQVPYHPLKRQWDIRAALLALERDLEQGQNIDSANLSFGESVPIAGLKQDFRLPDLSADNLDQYRDLMVRDFHKVKINRSRELASLGLIGPRNRAYIKDCVDTIERIAARDIPVFVAAGNAGPKKVNLLSFAKGATAVGAIGMQGFESDFKTNTGQSTAGKAKYSANNALVTQWAKSTNHFIPVLDEQGRVLGFTLSDVHSRKQAISNGKGKILLPLEMLSTQVVGGRWTDSHKKRMPNAPIWGTSFASPQVAAKVASQRAGWRNLKEGAGLFLTQMIERLQDH